MYGQYSYKVGVQYGEGIVWHALYAVSVCSTQLSVHADVSIHVQTVIHSAMCIVPIANSEDISGIYSKSLQNVKTVHLSLKIKKIQLCSLLQKFTNCLFDLLRPFSSNANSDFKFLLSFLSYISRANHVTDLLHIF